MTNETKEKIREEFCSKPGAFSSDSNCIDEQGIADWWLQKLDLAVKEREQEIIWIIEDLRGFPADVISEEQAEYIINEITKPEIINQDK